jgi:DNA-directed RNA polymerase subunit RPC12/RpoP
MEGGGLRKDSSLERFYDCINCMKTFRVSSVTEASAQIPETKVSVNCPVCNTPNTVTLPKGAKFIVSPAN